MNKANTPKQKWKSRSLRSDYEWEGMLVAYWEVALDPISDEYTPKETNALELFNEWARRVGKKYPDSLIPITWSVNCNEQGKFECMPFQFDHFKGRRLEDFLTFFTWPINSITGEKLNWLTLPVVDKLWNPRRADKGGFIQESTGWKPAILQPYVYLPTLTSTSHE